MPAVSATWNTYEALTPVQRSIVEKTIEKIAEGCRAFGYSAFPDDPLAALVKRGYCTAEELRWPPGAPQGEFAYNVSGLFRWHASSIGRADAGYEETVLVHLRPEVLGGTYTCAFREDGRVEWISVEELHRRQQADLDRVIEASIHEGDEP